MGEAKPEALELEEPQKTLRVWVKKAPESLNFIYIYNLKAIRQYKIKWDKKKYDKGKNTDVKRFGKTS